MSKSIYLINPAGDMPAYFSAEVYAGWGLEPGVLVADLATATVAAMVPDDFELRMCDEGVSAVDYDGEADYVALTGKVSQWGRMRSIADEFRRRGTTVIIGGPFASLCPEVVAPHCDVLVKGEIEDIAGDLFSDLRSGEFRARYEGNRPDLAASPRPRWDLYPNHRALMGCVQTSRGCPFECDFCDVIQYLGRKQRHKPVANVLLELEDQRLLGYQTIFLADDNFTAYRKRAKKLLRAIRDWNRSLDQGVMLITQISIDSAQDEEMIRLLAEAGVSRVFIGIETPNEESLRQSLKRQNVGVDLVGAVQRFYDYGLMVFGGMIVGFDSDGPDIFERQLEFAKQAALPIVSIGALVAPAATPLHDRIEREGRLVQHGSQSAASPWKTNIVPKLMTPKQLESGMKWLTNNLYSPAAFAERVLDFVERLGPRHDPVSRRRRKRRKRSVDRDTKRLIRKLAFTGREEFKMMARVTAAVLRKPQAFEFVGSMLFQYAQIRHMYDHGQFWEERLATEPAPQLDLVPLGKPGARQIAAL